MHDPTEDKNVFYYEGFKVYILSISYIPNTNSVKRFQYKSWEDTSTKI
jgi:hypothetical protein